MARHNDSLIGEKVGRLVVLQQGNGSKDKRRTWICKCDCGNSIELTTKRLRSNIDATKSCGCILNEKLTTHNASKTREYNIWLGIKTRCFDVNHHSYEKYGGKGITLYKDWVNNYQSFINYIGLAPSKKHSIDRIDNTKDYEPGNIRWATAKQQTDNRKATRLNWKIVNEIRTYKGCDEKWVAEKYDISLKHVQSIMLNLRWYDPKFIPREKQRKR